MFVMTIEQRQGLKIACLEEIALENGWLSREQISAFGNVISKTRYGKYLLSLLD